MKKRGSAITEGPHVSGTLHRILINYLQLDNLNAPVWINNICLWK